MAEKEFELDDPYEFVAVRFPVDSAVDQDEVMARCFIEEYALIGMPRERVLHLFQSPAFVSPRGIFESRGEEFVQKIIDDVYGQPLTEEVL
ncbi:MAG TPA: hypothetical protein VIH05_00950 [Tepidiformaceae bacterium]|jgi:hypothetical protein